MKLSAAIGFGSLWMALPGHGLEPLVAHVDITPTYDTGSREWAWALVADGVPKDPAASYFPGRDVDWGGDPDAVAGERYERPAGSGWDFLGMAEGQPVWIFTELDNQWAWVGFGNTQAGVFSAPLRVALTAVDSPPGSHFALFDSDGNVLMKTFDGISGADVWLKPAFHTHLNWSFSSKGMWRVRMTVFGYLGPGLTNPTPVSAEVPLHFAIGHRAQWRARHFDAATVMDEAAAGDQADPDGDGLVNLAEYALGGDPLGGPAVHPVSGEPVSVVAGRVELAGQEYPTLTFHRRIPGPYPEVAYAVEWSEHLVVGSWHEGGEEFTVTPVGGEWQRVTVRDTRPLGEGKRFGRVVVTAL